MEVPGSLVVPEVEFSEGLVVSIEEVAGCSIVPKEFSEGLVVPIVEFSEGLVIVEFSESLVVTILLSPTRLVVPKVELSGSLVVSIGEVAGCSVVPIVLTMEFFSVDDSFQISIIFFSINEKTCCIYLFTVDRGVLKI